MLKTWQEDVAWHFLLMAFSANLHTTASLPGHSPDKATKVANGVLNGTSNATLCSQQA